MSNITESNVISFELNNWFSGESYPPEEPFISWISHHAFSDDEWCKKNRLVVLVGTIDLSTNWCITATRDWVKENCPALLYDKSYTYKTIRRHYDTTRPGTPLVTTETLHDGSMSQFIRYPDEDGDVYGKFGWTFPEYSEENFGVHYYEEDDE